MEDALHLRPIGRLRNGKDVRFETRHQPDEREAGHSVLELDDRPGIREALRDLEGIERVWLVWWFDRAASWKPLVLPPRGPARRRGVFATRSPHRPNPLGITPVRLLAIDGLRLLLGACDLLDGTPVLDLKPYVPAYDSFPGSAAGWIDAVDAWMASPPAYTVRFAPLAEAQAAWLRERHHVDFTTRMAELLSRDPAPHRTRRIRARSDGSVVIGCGSWKGVFRVEKDVVTVEALEPAYPVRFLREAWREGIPDRDAQLEFLSLWPCPALEPRA